jgi:hypothetical protein
VSGGEGEEGAGGGTFLGVVVVMIRDEFQNDRQSRLSRAENRRDDESHNSSKVIYF